jgi:hypothetical protein
MLNGTTQIFYFSWELISSEFNISGTVQSIAKINMQFICNCLYEVLIRAYVNVLRTVLQGYDKNIKNHFPLYFHQNYSDFVGVMGNSVFVIDYKRAFQYTKFNLGIKSAFQGASKKGLYRIAPGYLVSCADYLSQLWHSMRDLSDLRDKICKYMLAMFRVTMHSQSVSHYSRLWTRYVRYQRLDCLHEYGFEVHDIWQTHLVEILLSSSLSLFLIFLSFVLPDIIITAQCVIILFLWGWNKLLYNKGNLLKQGICIL